MTLILFFILFTGLVFVLLNALPTATALPVGIQEGFTLIVGYVKAWDGIFAFTALLQAVAFMAIFFTALAGWYLVRWVVHLVRGGTN